MWLSKASAANSSAKGLRYRSAVLVAQAFRPGIVAVSVASQGGSPAILFAQTAPAPVVQVTFKDAIDRAVEKNPSVAAAASGILHAEGLIRQARAATQLQLSANVTTTTLNRGVDFQGSTVTPQNKATASPNAEMPIVS